MEAMNTGKLGHFALLEKIGVGGMGRVYKAMDARLGRLVAIKLLPDKNSRIRLGSSGCTGLSRAIWEVPGIVECACVPA